MLEELLWHPGLQTQIPFLVLQDTDFSLLNLPTPRLRTEEDMWSGEMRGANEAFQVTQERIHLPMQEMWVRSLGREDPLEKELQPTPVFLPGGFHGQRNLAGYRPWGCKELDTT